MVCYTQTREGPTPRRANPTDAGLDLPFNPEDNAPLTIQPGQSVVLQTGLRFAIPQGYMLEVKNRSGNASKRSLIVGACVVDPGYDGEVFVNLHNIGTEVQEIAVGMMIAQVVLIPVVHFEPERIDPAWLTVMNKEISGRGDGALGSTDKEVRTDLTSKDVSILLRQLFHLPNLPTVLLSGDDLFRRLTRFLRRLITKIRCRRLTKNRESEMYVVFADGSVMIEAISSDRLSEAMAADDWTTATDWLEKRYFGLGVDRVEINCGDDVFLSESKSDVE